jgi:hypothetical protein
MIDTVPPSRVRALSKSMDRSIAPAFYRTPYYVDLYGRHTAQPKANSIQLDIANDRVRFFINKWKIFYSANPECVKSLIIRTPANELNKIPWFDQKATPKRCSRLTESCHLCPLYHFNQ